jgi:hypothetical protein
MRKTGIATEIQEMPESVDIKWIISLHLCSGKRFERLPAEQRERGPNPAWEADIRFRDHCSHFPKNVRGASHAVGSCARIPGPGGLPDLATLKIKKECTNYFWRCCWLVPAPRNIIIITTATRERLWL